MLWVFSAEETMFRGKGGFDGFLFFFFLGVVVIVPPGITHLFHCVAERSDDVEPSIIGFCAFKD